jgi:beta-lactamase class D
VSKRAQDLTADILPVTKVGDSIIRAKTGLTGVTDKSMNEGKGIAVGWLVGWAERQHADGVRAQSRCGGAEAFGGADENCSTVSGGHRAI